MAKNETRAKQVPQKGKKGVRFYATNSPVSDDDLRDMLKWFAELQPKFGVAGIARQSSRGEGSHGWWQRFAVIDVERLARKRGHTITKYQLAKMERDRFKTVRVTLEDYNSLYTIWNVSQLQGRAPEALLEKMKVYMFHNGMAQAVFSDIVDMVWKLSGKPDGFKIGHAGAVGI